MGVDVVEGILRVGTPLCIPGKEFFKLGVVERIEHNNKEIDTARKKTGSIAVRIKGDK